MPKSKQARVRLPRRASWKRSLTTGTLAAVGITGGLVGPAHAPQAAAPAHARLATIATPARTNAYELAASDGGIFTFGGAYYLGSTGNVTLARPIVGMAATPDSSGYWLVASDGGVFTFGDAPFLGSTGNVNLARPIVGMATTPSGHGYWLVASDGGVFSFGDAPYLGSTGNIHLARPIVGMAATPTGHGYRLVASDGGVFSFGDANFLGSAGNIHLAKPIVGMATTPTGHGYWLTASDGGIFSFGDANFLGSTGNVNLAKPIVGMAATPDGHGYWLTASDGGIFTFGDAPYLGSTGNVHLDRPVVGMAPVSIVPGAPPPPPNGGVQYGTLQHPFAASAAINSALSGTSSITAQGANSVAGLLGSGPVADLYEFGLPIFTDVNAATPRYHVACTQPWGTCALSRVPVPIPNDAQPNSGSDGNLVVVDASSNLIYEFWQAKKSGSTWTASWGTVISLIGAGHGDIFGGTNSATASGLSDLYGTVTLSDVASGTIDHGLAFSSSLTCPTYIAPATGSDGHTAPPGCIPQGGRIQLDPSVNLAAIPGITPFELMIGKAMQTYGAICKDTGGASLALTFQAPTATSNPYPALGAPWDYWNMPHIPWGSIRVISG